VCDNVSISFGSNPLVAVGQGFVVLSVCCGYPTVCWPCRDALLDMLHAPCRRWALGERRRGSVAAATGASREPPLRLKRAVATAIVFSASFVAWFDPPFGSVIALLGAVGGCLCGFVMPSLAYMQVYHGEKPPWRRLLLTPAGWCLIFSLIFFVTNTFFVVRDRALPFPVM
jgi:hypothetical protein